MQSAQRALIIHFGKVSHKRLIGPLALETASLPGTEKQIMWATSLFSYYQRSQLFHSSSLQPHVVVVAVHKRNIEEPFENYNKTCHKSSTGRVTN